MLCQIIQEVALILLGVALTQEIAVFCGVKGNFCIMSGGDKVKSEGVSCG